MYRIPVCLLIFLFIFTVYVSTKYEKSQSMLIKKRSLLYLHHLVEIRLSLIISKLDTLECFDSIHFFPIIFFDQLHLSIFFLYILFNFLSQKLRSFPTLPHFPAIVIVAVDPERKKTHKYTQFIY